MVQSRRVARTNSGVATRLGERTEGTTVLDVSLGRVIHVVE